MSFIEVLRKSRSTPTAVLHQFLTSYDPNEPRLYVFVEGEPDKSFYKMLIERFLKGSRRLYVYNCQGKRNVYDAWAKVTARHPTCRNVLFFVDKDIDDIIGQVWPTDPRIFVTDVYSVENYLVRREALEHYITSFVTVRRVSFDLAGILAEFDKSLSQYHQIITPISAWIVVMRRQAFRVLLANVRLDQLFR